MRQRTKPKLFRQPSKILLLLMLFFSATTYVNAKDCTSTTGGGDGAIGTYVYNDTNGSNTRDFNELGVAGVEVTIDGNGVRCTTTTDSDGNYEFRGLPIRTDSDNFYHIRIVASSTCSPRVFSKFIFLTQTNPTNYGINFALQCSTLICKAPVANDDTISGLVGNKLRKNILENDVLSEDLQSISIIDNGGLGSNVKLNLRNNKLIVKPRAPVGTYEVMYQVTTSCGTSTGKVTVTIKEPEPEPEPIISCTDSIARLGRYDTTYVPQRNTSYHFVKTSWNNGPISVADVDVEPLIAALAEAGITVDPDSAGVSEHAIRYDLLMPSIKVPDSAPRQLPIKYKGQDQIICLEQKARFTWSFTPIALDIDGTGTVERISGEFAFDFAVNGEMMIAKEWFAPSEGILVDTRIPGPMTGAHLFGDTGGKYPDGYAKLATLDANGNGYISGAELQGLAIWTDSNSNAVADAGEISSLASHQIVSLSTSHVGFTSTVALSNGGTMISEDLWFPVVAPVIAPVAKPVASWVVITTSIVGFVALVAVALRRRSRLNLAPVTTTA